MSDTPINDLDVNDAWKAKFEIFNKAGELKGFNYANAGELTPKEGRTIGVNVLALLFGAFYYFYLGMWQKGAVLMGVSFLISMIFTVMESAGTSITPALYWLPGAAICSALANYDYYRFKLHGETMWAKLGIFNNPAIAIGFPAALLAIQFGVALLSQFEGNVYTVKTGVMTSFPQVTIGEAFDRQFEQPTWTEFQTDAGGTVVQFSGVTTENLVRKMMPSVGYEEWQIKAMIESSGSVGEAATFQWTMHVNGSDFDLTYIGGSPWRYLGINKSLDIIFK